MATNAFPYWNNPLLIKFVVGRVIVALSYSPFITPIIIKPFILVIEAVIMIEFRPAIGFWMDKVGVEKT